MTDYPTTIYKAYDTGFTMSWPPIEFSNLRMDPVEKQEWIDALLSGDYEQAKSVLTVVGGGSCCLGVYCEVKGVPKMASKEMVPIGGNRVEVDVYRYGDFDTDGEPSGSASTTFIPRTHGIKLYDVRTEQVVSAYHGRDTLFHIDLQGPDGSLPVNDPRRRNLPMNLPVLNDDGFTFAQIADVINYFL